MWFEESTVTFAGESSSVMKRLFGDEVERNSETTPEREMRSPAETDPRIVLFVENCNVTYLFFI